ncbi:MAG: methionine--tRNA ligase [Candidatus Aenigmatarchaeota archaeon]
MSEEKVLVTSALPYIHGIPHLGNIITSILPADVYYRYQRLKGKEAIYICGSDSHGTMYEIEAEEKGIETQELVYDSHELVKSLFEGFNFDFTYYGITDSDENRETTEHIFRRLDVNGYISERKVDVTYCRNCDRYLADRWIEGECPECGGLARGDQCDDCGVLLEPEELVDPYCTHCGKSEIEFRKSEHLFFQLQEFQDWLGDWLPGRAGNKLVESEAFSWLDEGLEERCISRDADWGFNVPKEGFEDKVFYVWFDAPIGYIAATKTWAKENGKDWEDWWRDDEVKYVQFMGKDNIPFHTIIFPSMLKGTEEEWNLADKIVAGSFLLAEDVKFSKSRGKGLNLESALEIKEGEYWRYVLMSLYPRNTDTKFSWDAFQEKINKELTDSFGNYVHRVLKFVKDNFDGEVPQGEMDEEVSRKVVEKVEEIEQDLEDFRFRRAVSKLIRVSTLGNQYFQQSKPWEAVESDPKDCKNTLYTCASIVKTLAIVSEPFLPETAEKIWNFLGKESNIHEEDWDKAKNFDLTEVSINEPEPLFEKVDKDKIPEFKEEKEFGSETSKPENKKFSGGEENMIKFDEFQELDLRIGEIKEVEEIKGSDNLFKMQIDVGDETKQSVGGFKGYYTPEEMEGRKVPVLVNLEPSELMGVKSECMLLAAVIDEDEPVLLEPERDLDAGTEIA